MKRLIRTIAIVLIILVLLITVLPLVIPVPPLFDTGPAAALADADSKFIQVNGLQVHYKIYGSGQPVMIQNQLSQGLLVQVLPDWNPPDVPVHAVFPSARYLTPKVRAFIDLGVEAF